MRLPWEFVRLPLQFDAERLAAEVAALDESEWRPHPDGLPGNSALILVSVNGQDTDDLAGPMAPAPRLRCCPYLRQVMASFKTVIGRSRLMRLDPGAEVKLHSDINFYWRERIRIHVPVVTDPAVRFRCAAREVHMEAGEAWVFDNWRQHTVINPSGVRRIHLVVDTVGTAAFWDLVRRGWNPFSGQPLQSLHPQRVGFDPARDAQFPVERYNVVPVAAPATVRAVVQGIVSDLQSDGAKGQVVYRMCAVLTALAEEWQGLWAAFGPAEAEWPRYQRLLGGTVEELGRLGAASITMPSNGSSLLAVANAHLMPLLNMEVPPAAPTQVATPRFDRPVFLVSAPRSGSTLLFETLQSLPDIWTIGDESHALFETQDSLRPDTRGYESNSLGRDDLTPEVAAMLRSDFARLLRDAYGRHYQQITEDLRPPSVRFLEKTPKNALRIPFLNALFPDALFVFLYREPRANISSLMDGWRSGKFVTYPNLPGWRRCDWSFLLIPGWRELNNSPLEEIAAAQWVQSNQAVLRALSELPRARWRTLEYSSFLAEPARAVQAIAEFAALQTDADALPASPLPLSRYTLDPPDPEKWRRNETQVRRVLPVATPTWKQLQEFGNRLL